MISPVTNHNDGQIPLLHTLWEEYEGAVKILLRLEEVNPNKLYNNS